MIRQLSYTIHSDEQLLALVQASDSGAFDEIYKRYGQKMFGYFYRMLGQDRSLAEDFTQELFFKLVKNLSDFDTGRVFSTWIYSIANNMCRNEYRSKEVKLRHHTMAVIKDESTAPVNPDVKKFKNELQKLVNEMTEEKRSLYILRFQDQLSVPEISNIFNVAEGTIKSRIFYLLKEIREKLHDFQTLYKYP